MKKKKRAKKPDAPKRITVGRPRRTIGLAVNEAELGRSAMCGRKPVTRLHPHLHLLAAWTLQLEEIALIAAW